MQCSGVRGQEQGPLPTAAWPVGESKVFFLKKEPKAFHSWRLRRPDRNGSFLLLFFKKEVLAAIYHGEACEFGIVLGITPVWEGFWRGVVGGVSGVMAGSLVWSLSV
jgi:hypothetical protein